MKDSYLIICKVQALTSTVAKDHCVLDEPTAIEYLSRLSKTLLENKVKTFVNHIKRTMSIVPVLLNIQTWISILDNDKLVILRFVEI